MKRTNEEIVAQLEAYGISQGEHDLKVTVSRELLASAALVLRGALTRPTQFDLMNYDRDDEGRLAPLVFARINRANHENTELDAAREASQRARGVL